MHSTLVIAPWTPLLFPEAAAHRLRRGLACTCVCSYCYVRRFVLCEESSGGMCVLLIQAWNSACRGAQVLEGAMKSVDCPQELVAGGPRATEPLSLSAWLNRLLAVSWFLCLIVFRLCGQISFILLLLVRVGS